MTRRNAGFLPGFRVAQHARSLVRIETALPDARRSAYHENE